MNTIKIIKNVLFAIIISLLGCTNVMAFECEYELVSGLPTYARSATFTFTLATGSQAYIQKYTGEGKTTSWLAGEITHTMKVENLSGSYTSHSITYEKYTLNKEECPNYIISDDDHAFVTDDENIQYDQTWHRKYVSIDFKNKKEEEENEIKKQQQAMEEEAKSVKAKYDKLDKSLRATCYYGITEGNDVIPVKVDFVHDGTKFTGTVKKDNMTYYIRNMYETQKYCSEYDTLYDGTICAKEVKFYATYVDIEKIINEPTQRGNPNSGAMRRTNCPRFVGFGHENNAYIFDDPTTTSQARSYAEVISEEEYDEYNKKNEENKTEQNTKEATCFYKSDYMEAWVSLKKDTAIIGWDEYFKGDVQTRKYGGKAKNEKSAVINMGRDYNPMLPFIGSFVKNFDGLPTYENINNKINLYSITQDYKNCPEYLITIEHLFGIKDSVLVNDKSLVDQSIARYPNDIHYAKNVSFEEFWGNVEVCKDLDECILGKNIEINCNNINELFGDPKHAGDGTANDPPSPAYIINYILTIVKILVPVALILFGSIDFAKSVLAGKEDEMKANQSKFLKRIVIGIAVFLTPAIVNMIMGIVDIAWQGENYTPCRLEQIVKTDE